MEQWKHVYVIVSTRKSPLYMVNANAWSTKHCVMTMSMTTNSNNPTHSKWGTIASTLAGMPIVNQKVQKETINAKFAEEHNLHTICHLIGLINARVVIGGRVRATRATFGTDNITRVL